MNAHKFLINLFKVYLLTIPITHVSTMEISEKGQNVKSWEILKFRFKFYLSNLNPVKNSWVKYYWQYSLYSKRPESEKKSKKQKFKKKSQKYWFCIYWNPFRVAEICVPIEKNERSWELLKNAKSERFFFFFRNR